MADSSRNPGDSERLGRLERELEKERARLAAMRVEAEEQLAAAGQTAKRLEGDAQQVRKERRQGEAARKRQPGAQPSVTPQEDLQKAQQAADATKRRAQDAERTASAVEREGRALTANAQTHRTIRRLGPPTGAQGPYNVYGGIGPAATTGPLYGPPAPLGIRRGPLMLPPARFIPVGGVTPATAGAYNRFGGIGDVAGPDYGPSRYERARGVTEAQKQTLRQVAGFQRLGPEAQKAAEGQLRFSEATRASAVAMGLNAQQMSRHGALTTEFIAAAARGEVTIRDLGNQIGLTIGKFAGWTIAATAVYGVVGALAQVGRGAIDAASGVDLVSRTLPEATQHADELQARFAELSHQFNLPIDDVTQAVYGMGKVFGTDGGLASALSASEQALFAVKVGELDAATATRYLTGIVSGFGLSAKELPAVFDAINQAQNRFGGNTGQLIAGVAKAAGSFRLVGGEYRELIALIQAGTRLTGTTGENVGTAISRSAGIVLTPGGQKRLAEAGLDPNQPYMELLEQAFREAQKAGPDRERVQEIARALVPSGGQFARVFVPLLQNRALYDRIFGAIAPDKARGSSERELQRALRQPNEQLKQMLTNTQQLGVQLARIGALDPFLALVKGVNTGLHAAERLLDLFNELPAPLRHSAVVMLEIAGLMRLMRRFDVGALIPGAPGRALSSSPSQRLRRESQIYLDEQRAAFVQTRNAVAGQAFRAQYDVGRHPAGTDEHTAAAARARSLEAERLALDREIARIDEQRVVVNRQIRGAVARDLGATQALLVQHGIPATGFDRRYGSAPESVAGGARYGAPVSQLGPRGPFQRFEAAMRAQAAESRTLTRLGVQSGVTVRATTTALGLAAGSMRLTGSAIRGAGGALRGFAAGAAAMLGPLEVIIATALIVPSILSNYREKFKELDRLSSSNFQGDPVAIRRKAAELRDKSKFQTFIDIEQRGFAELVNSLSPGDPAYAPGDAITATANELEAKAREMEALQKQGKFLRLPQIRDRLTTALKQAFNDPVEQMRAIRTAMKEVEQGRALNDPGATSEQRAEARQTLDALREDYAVVAAMRADVKAALASLTDAEQLETYIGERAARLTAAPQGRGDRSGRALGASIARAREQAATGLSSLSDALQNIERANQAVQQVVERDLNRGLLGASNASSRGALRADAIAQMRARLIDPLREEAKVLRGLARGQDAQVQDLQTDIINTSQDPARSEAGGEAAARRLHQLTSRRDKIREIRDGNRKALRAVNEQIREQQAIVREFAQDQQRQQLDEELEEFDARVGLAQARTRDPVAAARILASRLHDRTEKVRRGYHRHLKSLSDLFNAEQREAEALTAVDEAEFQRFQGQQSLGAARFELAHLGNRGAILNDAITRARRAVTEARQQGLGPDRIRELNETLVRAQIAYAEFSSEQADALADAKTNLALSRTEDPIKQAQIRLRDAYGRLRRAATPTERINAQADVNNARREVRRTRYQDQFDTIEFEAEMGKITRETEISRLKGLLKTIKGTRDFRRQVQLRIRALQKEAEGENAVELNVGNIRLPSIYDVRRLARLGTQNQLNVRQNISFRIDGAGDAGKVADEVFARFSQAATGGLKSAQRSVGVTG